MVVSLKAKRRTNAFENLLPDLLITLAASLKAGHSFKQGLQSAVEEGQEPVSKELKRVLTETQLGRPMNQALAEAADRIGSKNFSFVITAVTIQTQVGGSLSNLFDMIADTVRQRQQFARKIKGADRDGPRRGVRPRRPPVLHRGSADAHEPVVHGAAVEHVDGPHARSSSASG